MASKIVAVKEDCQSPHNVPCGSEEQGQDYLEHAVGAPCPASTPIRGRRMCSFSAVSASPFTSCSG